MNDEIFATLKENALYSEPLVSMCKELIEGFAKKNWWGTKNETNP